jgi:hypothetical protein
VTIVSAYLSTTSWYGHPEMTRVDALYQRAKDAAARRGRTAISDDWDSTLRCWLLLDAEGAKVARAYEPTELTPRWVFTDSVGHEEIEPPISLERLTALRVAYRLKGGLDVDALRIQA